jgi:large subunit ribosomal protein L24
MLRTTKSRQSAPVARKTNIKKNDEVVVLSGKDRGKQGKVLRVIPSKGTAIVERVNFTKKHTRKNPQKNVQGGILEREAPIALAKLQVVCPSCGKPTRIGSHRDKDGTRSRVCKNCEAELK